MGVGAKHILSSRAPCGTRITTMEIELHRIILPEFNTHRAYTRNFQSSRAIPLKRQRQLILSEPADPVFWGGNNPGMQSNGELTGTRLLLAKAGWKMARWYMVGIHYYLEKVGLHKQLVNRLLEPWMFTKGVVTGTDEAFQHFFYLRNHPAAQPEIRALAQAMYEEYNNAPVQDLQQGEWHLPYVTKEDKEKYSIDDCLKISVSCCAQVSYRRLDTDINKAKSIYGRLNLDNFGDKSKDPPHASPCEHQAKVSLPLSGDSPKLRGNLGGMWRQYRKLLGG